MEVNGKEVYRESEDTYSVLEQIQSVNILNLILDLWENNRDAEFYSIDENGESEERWPINSMADLKIAQEQKHTLYIKRYFEYNK